MRISRGKVMQLLIHQRKAETREVLDLEKIISRSGESKT
jgi:hypothetical protein